MEIDAIKNQREKYALQMQACVQRRADFERMLEANEREIIQLSGAIGACDELLKQAEEAAGTKPKQNR